MSARRVARFAIAAAALLACDSSDPAHPSAPEVQTASPPAPAIGVRRTVEDRSPFGNTAARGNLMVDGDFELTGRTGQMPWIALGPNGTEVLAYATGGLCRSGIRCARVAAGKELLGYLASPKDGEIHVVFWVKPHAVCAEAVANVVDVDDPNHAAPIAAMTPLPDGSGWCRFEGVTPSFARLSPALYVQIDPKSGGDVLVDDAVATAIPAPDGGAPDAGAGGRLRAFYTLSAPAAERVRTIAGWLKARRRFAQTPNGQPGPAR